MQTNLSFLKLFLFFILISNLSLAQLHPPGVEWQKEYAPTIDPFSTFELEEDNTGEDWWYDHKNSYNSGNQDGYICAGYANIVNEEIIEPSSGCSVSSLGAVQTCKEDYPNIYSIYKTLTNNFPTNPFTGSASLAIMSKMDLNGNPIWVRTFDQGQFFKVIQSADGGYVAVGQTQSSLNVSDLINPILYNPTTANPSGEITTCNTPCSFLSNPVTEAKAQLYVVKVDATGKLIWKYRYGYYNTTDPLFCATSNAGFDLVELGASPNFFYRIVGKSETREINSFGNGGNFWNTNGYILDINYNGLKLADEIIETTNFSPTLFSFNNFNAIKKSTFNGQDVVAITGTYGLVDRVGPQFWNRDIPVLYYPSGSVSPGATSAYGSIGFLGFNFLYSGNPNNAYDLTFDAKGNILIPAIVNCISGGCYGAGNNIATGEIVRYSPFSQSILNTYSLGVGHSTIHAFDLKMGITSTSDGGFAIVTTEVTNNYVQAWLGGINGSYSCGTDTFDIRTDSYWNSDAYVAKYDMNGILEWDKTIDEDPDNPPANYKTDFPEDYKKQECVYSISQANDGGYVVAGNYSDNLDDCYLFKLYSDCDSRLLADLITNNDPTFYNANTTPFTTSIWSTPTKVFGNLVIPAGESLTIRNTTVNFLILKALVMLLT